MAENGSRDRDKHGNQGMTQSPATSYFSPWGCNQSGPGNANSFKELSALLLSAHLSQDLISLFVLPFRV